ncbi:MAG: hypothetical protein EFT35_09465 [Methanophagales archaeon ANME-1-THS]|nr:MAG: hypothetical protein EFT35_09465 [Methanophagales archaeon ANME-1-THS]
MDIKESFEKVIMDGRTLLAIFLLAIVWRIFISLDGEIALWESLCSGTALIILGWALFSYLYHMSLKETDWLISNRMFQGLAVSLATINTYVVVYYGMRWLRLLSVEVYVPYDVLIRDVRYVMIVLCYCGLTWAALHLKNMHDSYMLLTKEIPAMRKPAMRRALFKVITDERTAIVLIAIAFFWRASISLDRQIVLWESMCSGIALFIMGWILFGYIISLAWRVTRPRMMKIYHGIALSIFAINLYVLAYYGMRWYRLITAGEEAGLVPLDFVFRDIRFFVVVIFYCSAIVLSKWLEKAAEECEFLVKKESEA